MRPAACSARSARPGFLALVAVILCYSMAFGLLEIGMTAYATEKGNAALAGVLLGLMSTGAPSAESPTVAEAGATLNCGNLL